MTPPSTHRSIDAREYAHDRLGEKFKSARSDYDTHRRVTLLIDEMLADVPLDGARVLDVGCGFGDFTERLVERGAIVTACDLGPNMVAATQSRVPACQAMIADALRLGVTFADQPPFDVVVSSECIEHTPDPLAAVRQMCQVLKPGGRLVFSTPNVVWQPVVRLASRFRLRPFDGYENFSSWGSLRSVLLDAGMDIDHERGLHLFPFQLRFHRLSTWCDRHLQVLRPIMINMLFRARKR